MKAVKTPETRKYGIWQVVGDSAKETCKKVQIAGQPEKGMFFLKTCKKPDRLTLFLDEIAALKKMNHYNVLRMVDYNDSLDNLYHVSQYCNGGTLKDVDFSGWDWQRKNLLWQQICAAHAYIHSKGIVKTDNGTHNIYLHKCNEKEKWPEVIIGDFGQLKPHNTRNIGEVWFNLGRQVYKEIVLR